MVRGKITRTCRHCSRSMSKSYIKKIKGNELLYNEFKEKKKQRFVSDPLRRVTYALIKRTRRDIGDIARFKRGDKSTLTRRSMVLSWLGCDVDTFVKHLENQFVEGMTWENYGKWHIDHIKPLCTFDHSNNDHM